MREYLTHTLAERLARLEATPDEISTAFGDKEDAALSRRPEARSWSATEIVCHLRDVEELNHLDQLRRALDGRP